MVENALRQLMLEEPNQVPVALVAWVVTGEWPAHQSRCDIAVCELPY
ncbi:hypothetical protein PJL70_08260 [Mycobacterium kansasii]|jgi:hypothetical protein